MADKKKSVPEDSSRVSLSSDHEVRFWCVKFGCTRANLEQAVAMVGSSATAVQVYFARSTLER